VSLAFRPMTANELPLVAGWLEREHVQRWWPTPAEGVAAHYGPALAGHEPTDLYLILLDARPVGLFETYLVSDHPDYELLVRVGPGVAGVDILIGELDAVGRGVGPAALRAFAREVVFADGAVTACVAGVDVENRRSLRAFEKAGFAPVRDYDEDSRRHRLLRLDRPA
jgi:aminoglycoside 6'-N-acetyltransferase